MPQSRHQHKKLSGDPLVWGLWLAAGRLFHKIKSYILAVLFHAPGLYLGPRCVIRGSRLIKFGRGVYATSNLWIEAVSEYRGEEFQPTMEIGDGVSFSHGVRIFCVENIVIERNVLLGSNIYISDGGHGSYRGQNQSDPSEPPAHRRLGIAGPVKIEQNVWIGDNAVILGPSTIGYGAVIGANSVVRGNIPAETIVGGIPARILKQFQSASGTWESA